jgi:hypothetical protein
MLSQRLIDRAIPPLEDDEPHDQSGSHDRCNCDDQSFDSPSSISPDQPKNGVGMWSII